MSYLATKYNTTFLENCERTTVNFRWQYSSSSTGALTWFISAAIWILLTMPLILQLKKFTEFGSSTRRQLPLWVPCKLVAARYIRFYYYIAVIHRKLVLLLDKAEWCTVKKAIRSSNYLTTLKVLISEKPLTIYFVFNFFAPWLTRDESLESFQHKAKHSNVVLNEGGIGTSLHVHEKRKHYRIPRFHIQ